MNDKELSPEVRNSRIAVDCFLDYGTRIFDSKLEEKVKCFKFAHIVNSEIGKKSIVGDLSKVDNCSLGIFTKIEKYNHLYYCQVNDFSYTGPYTVAMHSSVGKFSSLSWGVTIGGAEHDYERVSSHAFLYNSFFELNLNEKETYNRFEKPCVIGNDVWVGANSSILRGVKIGDGAVIAANSLVNKDVPPYCIVAGVPAKIIRFRFSEEIIQNLLEIKWWDFTPEVIKSNFLVFSNKLNMETIKKLRAIKKKS